MNFDFKLKSERIRFYKSNVWRGVNGIRNQVLKRDNQECLWCKEKGLVRTAEMGRLEIDHIKELEECTYEEAIDLNNLRTLCTRHHNERHNRYQSFNYQVNKWAHDEKW